MEAPYLGRRRTAGHAARHFSAWWGAEAPQLRNRPPWKAPPILVSGATAYRRGEFLYQDFLYDDSGARHVPDPGDQRTAGNLFSKPNGTYAT
jgi:hypothetical protein